MQASAKIDLLICWKRSYNLTTMKKIIIAVLALISIGSASAQFQVAHTSPTTYVVYGMRAGVSLKYIRIGEDYEYFLQLNTTNRYDRVLLIYLGNRDKARASLSQLLNELYKEVGKSYTLKDNEGVPFIAICSKTFGAEGYAIFRDGYAGHAYIRLAQISEMLELM